MEAKSLSVVKGLKLLNRFRNTDNEIVPNNALKKYFLPPFINAIMNSGILRTIIEIPIGIFNK